MFCKYCGKEIEEGHPFCPHCGSRLDRAANPAYQAPYQPPYPYQPSQPSYQPPYQTPQYAQKQEPTTLATVAFVFMIISTVLSGFFLIPLAWMLPMTLIFKKKIDGGLPVGTAFKVCTLLFVSTIAGILMLCDDKTP